MDRRFMTLVFERLIDYLNSDTGPGYNKISEIAQNLYLSDYKPSVDTGILKEYDIRAVLYLGLDEKPREAIQYYKKKKIDHLQINVEDSPGANLARYFETAYNFIHKYVADEKKVLVHCMEGVSRSPTIVAWYILRRIYLINFHSSAHRTKKLLDPGESLIQKVFTLVKECRPCVSPNPGFLQQLIMAESQMKIYFARALHEEYRFKLNLERERRIERGASLDATDSTDPDDSDDDEPRSLEEIIDFIFDFETRDEEEESEDDEPVDLFSDDSRTLADVVEEENDHAAARRKREDKLTRIGSNPKGLKSRGSKETKGQGGQSGSRRAAFDKLEDLEKIAPK
jgi:atypical dual specificity phosphatase